MSDEPELQAGDRVATRYGAGTVLEDWSGPDVGELEISVELDRGLGAGGRRVKFRRAELERVLV